MSKYKRLIKVVPAALLLVTVTLAATLLADPVFAQSQATTGVIEGTVTDESGATLPGVTITLVNTASNIERELVTSARGRFRAVQLPVGPYKLTAEMEGFETLVRTDIKLTAGQTIDLHLTMEVAAVDEKWPAH